jgi:hypothetical protein
MRWERHHAILLWMDLEYNNHKYIRVARATTLYKENTIKLKTKLGNDATVSSKIAPNPTSQLTRSSSHLKLPKHCPRARGSLQTLLNLPKYLCDLSCSFLPAKRGLGSSQYPHIFVQSHAPAKREGSGPPKWFEATLSMS